MDFEEPDLSGTNWTPVAGPFYPPPTTNRIEKTIAGVVVEGKMLLRVIGRMAAPPPD